MGNVDAVAVPVPPSAAICVTANIASARFLKCSTAVAEKLVNSILQCNMTSTVVAGMLRFIGMAGLKRPRAILLRYNQGRFAHPPWLQYQAAPFLHCLLGMHLSTHFNFEQFQQMTPLNGVNIWEYILDRHAGRIGVKRRKPALENLERIFGAHSKNLIMGSTKSMTGHLLGGAGALEAAISLLAMNSVTSAPS